MRLIAIVALSAVLVYIGIRMAISTVASEKATYKKMLFDWFTSLALIFLLHYIIIATLKVNNSLVAIFQNIATGGGSGGSISDVTAKIVLLMFHPNIFTGFGAILIAVVSEIITFIFLFKYIK